MGDTCQVSFDKHAMREADKLNKKEPATMAAITETIKHVIAIGWKRSTDTELIKVLDAEEYIGEIRKLREPSYRMIFYYEETEVGYEIVISAIAKKSILKKNVLNDLIKV